MAYFDAPYRPADLTVDSSHSLVTNMQAWFPLTEGYGTSVQCILHPSHTGTVTNGTWQTGDGGTELRLNGSGSFVTIGDLNLSSANGLTVTAWIDGPSYGNQKQIVTRDNSGVSRHWQFRIESNNKLNLIRFDSSNTLCANFLGATTLTHNVRHFVAFTFDSSAGSVIYLNGEADGTDSNTTANNSGTGTDILIGARRSSGAIFNSLDAGVQNCRVYDRALSASEIATLYTRPWTGTNYDTEALWLSPPASPTLSTASEATSIMADIEGWWVMTDASGTTLTDISGNGRDATLNGTNTWETETLGTVNRFDNSSSSGNNATTAQHQISLSNYTVAFWVKNEDAGLSGAKYGAGVCLTDGAATTSSDVDIYFRRDGTRQWPQLLHNRNNGGTYDYYDLSESNKASQKDVWKFWAITFNGTNAKVYSDASLVGTSGTLAAPLSTTGKHIVINGVQTSSTGLTCSMQNVRLYSRCLSSDEISLLYERPWIGAAYNETAPLYPPVPSSLTPLDSSSINTDLQGWWPLTEEDNFASGATDISGNSYNLTKTGTVTSEFSALGTVPLFDGSTGYLRRAQDLSSHTSGVGTISLWWRLDSTAANNPGDVLFYMGDESTAYTMLVIAGRIGGSLASASISFLTYASGSPQNLLGVYDNGAAWAFDDTWHHFCYVVNSSSNHMYIDGVEISQSYYPGYGSSSTGNVFLYDATNFDAIRVGSRSASSATSAYTQGNVSNVRLWSRALSSTEVADIFYSPWLGSAYPSTGGGTPSYFVAAQFNRLGIGPRFRRL